MRFIYLLVAFYFTSTTLQASTTEQALADCTKRQNDAERLSCYDQISERLGLHTPPAKITNNTYTINTEKPEVQEPVIDKSPPIKEALIAEQTLAPTAKPKTATLPVTTAPTQPKVPKQKKVQSTDTDADFGIEHKKEPTELKQKIYAQVVEIEKNVYKKLTLEFDNNQQWKQVDSVRFKVKKGDTVYVERGALDSFFLSKDGIKRRIRVKRIK